MFTNNFTPLDAIATQMSHDIESIVAHNDAPADKKIAFLQQIVKIANCRIDMLQSDVQASAIRQGGCVKTASDKYRRHWRLSES